MTKLTPPGYRKPVLVSLHDLEVPQHLPLHKKGIRQITITRLNSRQMYMARLAADSPPTADQRGKRLAVMNAFATEKCPDCQKQIAIDNDGDPRCTACGLILYPPPSRYLAHLAGSYMDAMRDVRPRKVWSSRLTAIFLAHHAAEMHLKALGACSAFTDDSREEYLYGSTFNYNQHNLVPLLNYVHVTVKSRLDKVHGSGGQSIDDLVRAMPRKTSELFRYGLLLKDSTKHEVRTTVDGDIRMGETNLSETLRQLCELLEEFTSNELSVLACG